MDPELLAKVPAFAARLDCFLNTADLAALVSRWTKLDRRAAAAVRCAARRMKAAGPRMSTNEVPVGLGVRALSRAPSRHPYTLE